MFNQSNYCHHKLCDDCANPKCACCGREIKPKLVTDFMGTGPTVRAAPNNPLTPAIGIVQPTSTADGIGGVVGTGY